MKNSGYIVHMLMYPDQYVILQCYRVWVDNCPSQKAQSIYSNKQLLSAVNLLSTHIQLWVVMLRYVIKLNDMPFLLQYTHMLVVDTYHTLTLAFIYFAITQTTKPVHSWINVA